MYFKISFDGKRAFLYKIIGHGTQKMSKGHDTQGNFLSNVAGQSCRAWAFSR